MSLFWLAPARQSLALPSLEIVLNPLWGSRSAGHRAAIRQALAARFPAANPALLLDTKILPRVTACAISISHSEDIGGFACAETDQALGFDVEIEARIQSDVIDRVADADEMSGAPFSSAIWCAKEAAFKALDRGRGLSLFGIKVGRWQEPRARAGIDAGGFWTYVAASADKSRATGVLARDGHRIYAVAIAQPDKINIDS